MVFGAMLAAQARVNGALGEQLGDGYLAALLSFVVSVLCTLLVLPFWRPGQTGIRALIRAVGARQIPWWHLAGGAAGALFVVAQSLTAAVLGVAMFTVASVSGQTIGGLVIDRTGFGSLPPTRLTWPRLTGSALALVAVVVAVSPQLQGEIPFWMLVLPLIAGFGAGFQQAANGEVREASGSAHTAGLVSGVVGTAVLAVVVAGGLVITGPPPALPTDWWLYTGGLLGALFIAGGALVVRFTGVLLLGLGMIAGQLVASLLLDILLPTTDEPVHPVTVLGTVLTLIAVVVATIPARTRR
jgi:bacterial/archaeal transporter family-2 protein